MPSKNRLTINLSPEEYFALDQVAVSFRVSKAWLGRLAISTLLERIQNDEMQLPLPLRKPQQKQKTARGRV